MPDVRASSSPSASQPPTCPTSSRKLVGRGIRGCDILISIGFLLVGSPLFLLVGFATLLTMGWPVLYFGDRMGRNKASFRLIKFRTLPKNAEKQLGTETAVGEQHHMCSFFTLALRSSRFDELPQLINILRGDMSFVGPRPVRAGRYEYIQRTLSPEHFAMYERRFTIRPGLIGYPALLAPHDCPFEYHARMDSMLFRKGKLRLREYLRLIAVTIFAVSGKFIGDLWEIARDTFLLKVIHRRASAKRDYIRVASRQSSLSLWPTVTTKIPPETIECVIRDISEEYVRIGCPVLLDPDGIYGFRARITLRSAGKKRTRSFLAAATFSQQRHENNDDSLMDCVLKFVPERPIDIFRLKKYFLRKSIL
jgi:lipopolysaccharide/colanic/teichoic acid biosynthesis glycosyltransferase